MLKLQFKTLSDLLRYVNFGAVAACRVFVCESYGVQMSPAVGVLVVPYSVCYLYKLQNARCSDKDDDGGSY